MRIIIGTIIFILLAVNGYSKAKYDVRKVKWGYSKKQVMKIEGRPITKEENLLCYDTKVAGYGVTLSYFFHKNKLFQAMYNFKVKRTNLNDYIYTDYASLSLLLNRKYGKGESRIVWKNKLYQKESNYHGLAVSLGHVLLSKRYITPQSSIYLILGGTNYKIDLAIMYKSKKLSKIADEEKQKKQADDL